MSEPGASKAKKRRNVSRRALGVLGCFSPVLLAAGSLYVGLARQKTLFGAWYWTLPALSVAGLNFYLSFIRPRLHQWKHGSMEGCKFISGVPLVGTILVVVPLLIFFGVPDLALLGLIVLGLDTGGLPWFLICTWNDESLWDQ